MITVLAECLWVLALNTLWFKWARCVWLGLGKACVWVGVWGLPLRRFLNNSPHIGSAQCSAQLTTVAWWSYQRRAPWSQIAHIGSPLHSSYAQLSLGSSTRALPIRSTKEHFLNSIHQSPKDCCTSVHTTTTWGCIRIRFSRGWSLGSTGPYIQEWPLRTDGDY